MSAADAGPTVDCKLTETDVAFMKEQHSRTIFELRAEISLLRQKNSDMTMASALSLEAADGTCVCVPAYSALACCYAYSHHVPPCFPQLLRPHS